MNVWKEFENWRDDIYCGGEPEKKWISAEIGAKYELFYAPSWEVEKTVICSPENKDEIEKSLNDDTNDIWWYRKA